MKFKNIQHVFFDLDHTLWDFDKNSGLAFAKMFQKNNIEVDLTAFLTTYSPINFKYWKWYREDRVTKEQLRYGRFKKTFDALNISVTDDIINRLSDDYIRFLPDNNHLFEGTIEILEYLSQQYTLHIITNGFEEVQNTKLLRSNLTNFFSVVMTSEAAGVKKPHHKIFDMAFEAAGASPHNSVMIGDTYEADIIGAESVGMQTICYNYHNLELPKEQIAIKDLVSIKDYL